MRELYKDIEDRSRDAAQNIRIAFDESAWDKMKALLDEDDLKPVDPVISNGSTVDNSNKIPGRVQLFLLFLFLGVTLLFVGNYNIFKNKTRPLVNNETKASDIKARENNQQNIMTVMH